MKIKVLITLLVIICYFDQPFDYFIDEDAKNREVSNLISSGDIEYQPYIL